MVDSGAEQYEEKLLREFRRQLLDDEDQAVLMKVGGGGNSTHLQGH